MSKENRLRGGRPPMCPILEAAIKYKLKRLQWAAENNTEVYFLEDIESGVPYEVSKEHYESWSKTWEVCMPKLDSKFRTGQIMFFGTGGNSSHNKYYEELFYKPDINHLHIEWPETYKPKEDE